MLESLREIGLFSLSDQGKTTDDVVSILLENPVKGDYQTVVAICFEPINDQLVFTDIQINHADKVNYFIYLYKKKGSQGANYTPCGLVAGKGIDGTFKNRIFSWANQNKNELGTVGKAAVALVNYSNNILEKLLEKDKSDDLSNTILTIKINGKFIGEIDEFKEYFLKNYYNKKSEIAFDNGVCSLCGEKGYVMGDEKPWSFYSLDKPGFIASGFLVKMGWKNFPICKKCSLLVEEGKQHVEKNLKFRFSGIQYFLLPKSISRDKKVLEEVLDFLEKERKEKLKFADFKNLADDEDDILQFAAEQNDIITYNFLFFYKPNKNQFSILLYLQDILPSTIKQLFNAKEYVEKYWIFKNTYKEKKELKNIIFTFKNINTFISTKKIFLNLVERIFKRRMIDYSFLIHHFLVHLRQQFINYKPTKPDTLKAWQILLLLEELGILANKSKGETIMPSYIIQNDVKGKIEAFFSQFKSTFDSAEKRAIFLTGVLTNFLLRIQQNERGSDPFRKNLKGLKMRRRDILQIYPEAQNKLEEYGKNYYTQLEQVVAEYFVRAGSKWQISDDEINFYFLLGMDLCDARTESGEPIFKADSEDKESNKETNQNL